MKEEKNEDLENLKQKDTNQIRQPCKNTNNIIDIISKNAGPLTELIKNFADKWIDIKETESKFSMRMSILAVFVVSFIVAVAAILTYFNKIEGATFTFLLGMVVGYMLTFIREAIYPKK